MYYVYVYVYIYIYRYTCITAALPAARPRAAHEVAPAGHQVLAHLGFFHLTIL